MAKNKKSELIKNSSGNIALIENGGQILYDKISALIEQSRRAKKIQTILAETRERMAERNVLIMNEIKASDGEDEI